MPTRRILAWALGWLVLTPAVAGAGTAWAPATLEQYFRVEWSATPALGSSSVSGSVTNLGAGPAERVQLLVESLDAAGTVVGSSAAYVVGGVPASQRGYFSARVPAAATYRVRIVAFDWAGCRN
jgi:hypothetical protein